MVDERDVAEAPVVDVGFAPQAANRALPVEILDRAAILLREGRSTGYRQRLGFHVLMLVTSGHGSHVVDFESVAVSPGTCVRIHPGQVHSFVPTPAFDARVVVWHPSAEPADPAVPAWFPGCGAATSWHLGADELATALDTVDQLAVEQSRFDGSQRRAALLRSMLRVLVLRLAIAVPDSVPDAGQLPKAYLELRRRLEERLHERPSVRELADELGYSTRTLDRASKRATDRTAKQVVDERIALEVRRLLAHTDLPVARIAADLGFDDASNFSKFVKRQIGQLPTQVRSQG